MILQQTTTMTQISDTTDSLTVIQLDCKIHQIACAIRQNHARNIEDAPLRIRFFDLVLKWEQATGLAWGAISNQLYFEKVQLVNFYRCKEELRPWIGSHLRGEMVGELLHGKFRDQTRWLRVATVMS